MKEDIILNTNDALIIVDVQSDFLPGGALPVPEGDQVIPILNDYIDLFRRRARVYATRDWHPVNHISFRDNGGPWPSHCIQESDGAGFGPGLKLPTNVTIISHGTDPKRESYSGFEEGYLSDNLRLSQVGRLFVGGLATDYCVKNTVLDALDQGFKVFLLTDATRGINLQPGDAERAIDTMVSKGAKTAALEDFPEPIDISFQEPVAEGMAEKPLIRADEKKKARLRSRGPYRKARVEH